MQNVEFPEVKERVETKVCCAHNVTKGCSVSSKVAVADLALQPLRALKMLMDGLACDGVSSLWLRSLLGPPLMMHLFPFDFVYLDEDLRIVDAVELFPNMPFPKTEPRVASALILPLRTLASTGTMKGDQLIICDHEEIDLRLADLALQQELSAIAASPEPEAAVVSVAPDLSEAVKDPPIADTTPAAEPAVDPRIPVRTNTASPSAGFTVSLATSWQISGSTMSTAVLPEAEVEAARKSAISIEEAPVEEVAAGATTVAEAPAAEEPESNPGPVVNLAVEEVKPVAASKTAERTTPEANAQQELTVIADRLCEAVAAAEAAEAAKPMQEAPAVTEEPISDPRIARSKEAWEKTTAVKTPRPNAARPIRAKKKVVEPKKDPLGTRVIRWLNLEDPLPERRGIIRLRLQGLQAYDTRGDKTQRYEMRDVCPTGFCLQGQEKSWTRGKLVSIVVEKKGAAEKDRQQRVRIQARVIRCEEDGTGFEFVFPKGTEFEPWKRAKTKRSDETEAEFILRELRLSNALGFLRRLCPGGAEEVRHAMNERLSNKRVASAVDIALLAEDALARHGHGNLACAHADIVMRVIEGGSWIEDGWIRRLWSGLLVSACTADGHDTSNQPFIDLLAKLTPLHLRMLAFVCRKAVEAIAAGKPAKQFYLDCSADELMEASDSHSFARIQQTIGHLSGYGLFADTSRPSYVALTDKSKTRLAPTALGLKMWARCNGQRA